MIALHAPVPQKAIRREESNFLPFIISLGRLLGFGCHRGRFLAQLVALQIREGASPLFERIRFELKHFLKFC